VGIKLINEINNFSLRDDFLTPKVFLKFGGCRTYAFCSGKKRSNSFTIPRLFFFRKTSGYPNFKKAALAKIIIRSKPINFV